MTTKELFTNAQTTTRTSTPSIPFVPVPGAKTVPVYVSSMIA